MAAAHGGERAEPTVFLADNGVHSQRSSEVNASGPDGFDRDQDRREATLHVAGAPPVQHPADDRSTERVRSVPFGDIARRHDVHVSLEDQRWLAVPAGRADDSVGLGSFHLGARKFRIRRKVVEVDAPRRW